MGETRKEAGSPNLTEMHPPTHLASDTGDCRMTGSARSREWQTSPTEETPTSRKCEVPHLNGGVTCGLENTAE